MAMKIRLRRNQFELSKKSAAMAIWLGKQYLDQKDSIEVESSITDNTREEIGVLIDELNKTRSGTDTDVDTV
jgi:hypothetical protein